MQYLYKANRFGKNSIIIIVIVCYWEFCTGFCNLYKRKWKCVSTTLAGKCSRNCSFSPYSVMISSILYTLKKLRGLVRQRTIPTERPSLVDKVSANRLCDLVVRVPGYRSRGPGFDSRCYQIFWEEVGLEQGPLSLMRIIEELLESTVAALVWKTEINGHGDLLRWPRDILYPLKLALYTLSIQKLLCHTQVLLVMCRFKKCHTQVLLVMCRFKKCCQLI
jgi:hypothetical protein